MRSRCSLRSTSAIPLRASLCNSPWPLSRRRTEEHRESEVAKLSPVSRRSGRACRRRPKESSGCHLPSEQTRRRCRPAAIRGPSAVRSSWSPARGGVERVFSRGSCSVSASTCRGLRFRPTTRTRRASRSPNGWSIFTPRRSAAPGSRSRMRGRRPGRTWPRWSSRTRWSRSFAAGSTASSRRRITSSSRIRGSRGSSLSGHAPPRISASRPAWRPCCAIPRRW